MKKGSQFPAPQKTQTHYNQRKSICEVQRAKRISQIAGDLGQANRADN